MDVISFALGVIFAAFFLPICFIIIVSIRRSILDGSYIDNISSKYILITGCDSGFGFALAKRLDSLGCHVVATCLTKAGQDGLKAVVSSRVNILSMDVTKMKSIEATERRVAEILPSADALWGIVNNSGIHTYVPVFDFDTLENMKQISEVNLWGTVAVTKTFLPYLKKSKGRIVNMGSIAGRVTMPGYASYSISKFGVSAFTDCIRLELSLFGISVHLLEPGGFQTNIFAKSKMANDHWLFWNKASEELRQEYGEDWLKFRIAVFQKLGRNSDSAKLHHVIDCMEHALLSKNAKKRYFPGFNSTWVSWWASLLPAELSDAIVLQGSPIGTLAMDKGN